MYAEHWLADGTTISYLYTAKNRSFYWNSVGCISDFFFTGGTVPSGLRQGNGLVNMTIVSGPIVYAERRGMVRLYLRYFVRCGLGATLFCGRHGPCPARTGETMPE
jgi:hypothetical protein